MCLLFEHNILPNEEGTNRDSFEAEYNRISCGLRALEIPHLTPHLFALHTGRYLLDTYREPEAKTQWQMPGYKAELMTAMLYQMSGFEVIECPKLTNSESGATQKDLLVTVPWSKRPKKNYIIEVKHRADPLLKSAWYGKPGSLLLCNVEDYRQKDVKPDVFVVWSGGYDKVYMASRSRCMLWQDSKRKMHGDYGHKEVMMLALPGSYSTIEF